VPLRTPPPNDKADEGEDSTPPTTQVGPNQAVMVGPLRVDTASIWFGSNPTVCSSRSLSRVGSPTSTVNSGTGGVVGVGSTWIHRPDS